MRGFCLVMTVKLASDALDAIKRDIDEAAAAGTVPITFWVLGGVLLGTMVAGLIGAIIGGIAGMVLGDAFNIKTLTA